MVVKMGYRQCWDQLPPCKQAQDVMIIKVTCPEAGLPFKHCSSVYAILSALFPGQNVSLIGNSINSHEFTGNTILSKKDIVSLASLQDPLFTPYVRILSDFNHKESETTRNN